VSAIVTWILAQPILRTFCMELCVRVFAGLLSGSKSDPNFRAQFVALTSKLAHAETEEEKRHALNELKSLRPHR
jgi:hypothetical protein